MKTIWLSVFILFTTNAWANLSEEDAKYLPELKSASWSPDLTKEDINVIRLAIYGMSIGNATDARTKLAPYIHDKQNVEARYIYALTLAWLNIDGSIEMLKELSIEGYPYALETYREERVCKLKKYKHTCEKYGFNELMKHAFLNWAKKDPLIPDMYFFAVTQMPNVGLVGPKSWVYTDEAVEILKKGVEANSPYSAYCLYISYLFQAQEGDTSMRKERDHYKQITKKLMFSGTSWEDIVIPDESCYDNFEQAINNGNICLNSNENMQLLFSLAKRGNLHAFQNLISLLGHKQYGQISFYDYIRFGDDGSLPKETKALYDEAIKLNNGRGWAYHGYSESIEPWEKLYKNKKTKSFFEKVGNLLNK